MGNIGKFKKNFNFANKYCKERRKLQKILFFLVIKQQNNSFIFVRNSGKLKENFNFFQIIIAKKKEITENFNFPGNNCKQKEFVCFCVKWWKNKTKLFVSNYWKVKENFIFPCNNCK